MEDLNNDVEFDINDLYNQINKDKHCNVKFKKDTSNPCSSVDDSHENQYTQYNQDDKYVNVEGDDDDVCRSDKCTNCGSIDRIKKYGFFICMDCGSQTSIIIDTALESRDYGQSDTKTRNPRCETFKNDMSLSKNEYSSIALTKFKTSASIISKIHNWNSRTYEENTLHADLANLKSLAENYGINVCIIREAQHIYKQIYEQKHKKKAKKLSIQAACIQCACKLNNVPRDSNEMAEMFNIPKKDIRRGAKQFEEIWCIINENNDTDLYKDLQPSNSVDFLLRRCHQLNLSEGIIELCSEVCTYIEEGDFLIKHIPLSRVAVGIYFTCHYLNISINKYNITEICGISEVTINKCFQKLLKIKDIIVKNTSLKNH